MSLVNFKKGLLAQLPPNKVEGTFYVTTDERAIYLDVDNFNRIRLSDFQEFDNLEALNANKNPSKTALYYVKDINCLAKWDGSKYVQINLDTGATSVEIVEGGGNAVTAASYDASTRKLTLTKGTTFAVPQDITDVVGTIPDKSEGGKQTVKEYVDAKTAGVATDANLKTLEGKVTAAESDIDALQLKVGEHTVSDQIDTKISALNLSTTYEKEGAAKAVQGGTTSTVKIVEDALGAYKTSNDEAVKVAKQAGTDAMTEAQKRVASVAAGDKSVTVGGADTAPTVAVALSQDGGNALKLAADGLKVIIPAAAEYSIAKDKESGEFAAVYHLTKDGVNVEGATINIPKDMVVQSGSVVTDPIGQPAGTYIKLVLQNVKDPLYINVGDLIEYVTSGSASDDMVVVAVSEDHKVTASITDGKITLAKMEQSFQDTWTKLNGLDSVDGSVANAKKAGTDASAHADSLNTAMNTRVEAAEEKLDILNGKAETPGSVAEAKKAGTDASAHANELNTAMDKRVKTAESSITTLTGEGAGSVKKAEVDAKAYADGLAKNYDAAGTAETKANAVLGASNDDSTKNTVYGAKKAATEALANAKTYTDTALTWGSFAQV